MKTFVWIILLGILSLQSYGQENSDGKPARPSIVKKSHKNEMTPVYNENLDDLCVKYRNIRNTGIVVSSGGAGLMIAGTIMMQSSKEGNIYISDAGKPYRGTSPVRKGGIAAVTVGALSLIAGLPMTALGAIKLKRTCQNNAQFNSSYYLQLNSGSDGVGVAMKF